ncbi:pilus assembly PilX N-terminal domain-containing protein [Kurthia gibsonii]|uniref:pilus assembly PilX N-terminal domain-containing protein n=1 Tax=Kurthia gibsonii TaxID=33946 RepID=UPI002DBFC863|nr:pilus assembly PilX N-terminal domain-containing protein [Kurthia gibsonii]MEB7772788.1 pilus assembly PilX N-terminal domain-containing protein [Kurthia gibsonii]
MRKYVKSNDGYALVIALLVITVVTVLGLGILTTTSSSKKLSEEESKDQTAYYIAEAGLNQKKEELKEIPNLYNEYIKNKDIKNMKEADIIKAFLEEIKNNPILDKETIYREDIFKRKNAEAKVIVTIPSETELKFTITSTGIIKSTDSTNEKKRTVQSVDSYKLAITEKPAEEEFGTSKYVIHALGNFSFIGNVIKGKLGFKQSSQGKANIFPYEGWGSYYGTKDNPYNRNTALEDGIANDDLVFNDSELPKIPEFPKEKFISLDTITQPANNTNIKQGLPTERPIPSGSYKITRADLDSASDLNIGNNNVDLYLPEADLKGFQKSFIGVGNLNILTNSFQVYGNTNINFDSINLTIYSKSLFRVSNTGTITTKGNIEAYSSQMNLTENSNILSDKKIYLYMYDSFSMGNGSTLKSPDSRIYYTGLTQFNINGGFGDKVLIDSLYSSLLLNSGVTVEGNIILRNERNSNEKININGGSIIDAPLYVYAPKFDMKISNGATVFGSVIGKNIEVTDGANITYKQPPPNNGGSTGGATGGGSIDSSLTPNSDSGSIEVNNP